MKKIIRKGFWSVALTLAGALGGFLYWRYVGCESGTCLIKSTWYLSTLWGAVLGWLIGSFFSGKCCGSSQKCS